MRSRRGAEELAQTLGESGRSAAGNGPTAGLMQGENPGAGNRETVRLQDDAEPRDTDDARKSLQRRMRPRRRTSRIVAVGHGIERFCIREGELGGMQIVGERNGGKQKGQDADQSDEALPFPLIRRTGAQLRQPSQAPYGQESDGNGQPDRVEEKLHAALILEQAAARGNWGPMFARRENQSPGAYRRRPEWGQDRPNIEKAHLARGRAASCTPIALSNRGREAFRRRILRAVKL